MSSSSGTRPYLARTPVALAHRGGALYGPNVGLENTLTAFRNAVGLGYTHVETDVHVTRDGRLVAFHDIHLDRVSDTQGRIRDLTWDELSRVRVDATERIPLLTELLDELPGVNVNIDLKAPGTAAPLWRLVEERGLHDRVCVGSFSQRRVGQFRRLARGRVATAASWAGGAVAVLGPHWLSTVLRTPADVYQVPGCLRVAGREVPVVTPRLVRLAHRLGKQVHVWTVDDPAAMHRYLDTGVDGIVTDRIDVLRAVLVDRGQWTGAA
ncbi:MAG TPA: glycerophosphodiester phosphodiesterase [Intrasporangium sp.]|uniref:glycerophosphodiester phosphodiesterase n=1 Tax=Intrasporangium sp. TaxID=1925024 RepID=UPI002D77C601|nr:glycerophosphodiester phosphodiesterase [Intrasporangium sp.]HET7398592.1 glycerophosphodiester phosphodiesterase [Intrasporangium sp.]